MRSVITGNGRRRCVVVVDLGRGTGLGCAAGHRLADFATKQYDRLGSLDLPTMGLEWLVAENANDPVNDPVDEATGAVQPAEETADQVKPRDNAQAVPTEAPAPESHF